MGRHVVRVQLDRLLQLALRGLEITLPQVTDAELYVQIGGLLRLLLRLRAAGCLLGYAAADQHRQRDSQPDDFGRTRSGRRKHH